MKICFCSTFLNDENYAIKNSKIAPLGSIHKFNLNIIDGLNKNLPDKITIVNTEKTASYPNYKKIIIRTKKEKNSEVEYINIGRVNLPVIKDITETIILYKTLKKWIISESGEEKLFLCAYGRRLSQVIAINLLKRKYKNINTCMILGDLSGAAACKTHKYNIVKEKISDSLLEFQVNQSKKFDSFVLITKDMASYLGIQNKPYTVMEGICRDIPKRSETNERNNKKIILYSGILSRQYGVDLLINAFNEIQNNTYELWIFGDGELKEWIREEAKKNTNIKFYGYIQNDKLLKKMKEATILINTRQNLDQYTKYSFPSKNIEYLSMGKPVIGYKLDGIPDEYDEYIHYIQDNSINSLKEKIVEICNYDEELLKKIGEKNYEFILNNKNTKVQVGKIIEMFEEIIDK